MFPHADTSAYAYDGATPLYNDPYRYDGAEDPYGADRNETVEAFCNCAEEERSSYDSIFGLGNKKKQAERKLRRAKRQASKGHYKKAQKLTSKAGKLLDKIGVSQSAVQEGLQKLQNVNVSQSTLDKATEAAFNPDTSNVLNPLSVQAMSPVASANQPNTTPLPAAPSGAGGGGGDIPDYGNMVDTSSYNTGVESEAQAGTDEPTGMLAEEKTLGGVTVTGKRKKKMPIALIIGGAVVILIAIIYFAKGKKGMKF